LLCDFCQFNVQEQKNSCSVAKQIHSCGALSTFDLKALLACTGEAPELSWMLCDFYQFHVPRMTVLMPKRITFVVKHFQILQRLSEL
jgi:hypothetical protein